MKILIMQFLCPLYSLLLKKILCKYRYRASWLEFPGGIFVELQSKCGWHLFFVTLGLLFWSSTERIHSCQHNEFSTLVVSEFYNPFSCLNEAQYSGALCFQHLWKCEKGVPADRRDGCCDPNHALIPRLWEAHCNSEARWIFFPFHVDGRHTKL